MGDPGHREAAVIVAAARACIGTRFRAQGRNPGLGLDCVGVALTAAAAIGVNATVPAYRIGGGAEAGDLLAATLSQMGCRRIASARPGDVLVVAPAPDRRHLALVSDRGIVHAHAGLGHVVEGPPDPSWTPIAAWRLPEKE